MQESIRHAEQLLEKAEVVTLAVNGEDGCPRAYVMTKLPGESIRVFPFLAKEGSEKVRGSGEGPPGLCQLFRAGRQCKPHRYSTADPGEQCPEGALGSGTGPDLPDGTGERRTGADPV